MTATPTGNSFLVLATMVFVAVLLLLEGLYLLWKSYKGPAAKKISRRLQALSAAGDSSTRTQVVRERLLSELPFMERFLFAMPRAHRLDRVLLQADLRWTVSRLMLTAAASGVAGYFIASSVLQQLFLSSVLAGAMSATLPVLFVYWRRAKRLRKLERQLPDALDLLTRAIRSGHAFPSALKMIGDEMADPIAGEFALVHDEINFGVSLEQALQNLGERVPVTDLRYFVVAVLVQRESGGNLGEVLTNLSRLIRERLKLMGKVKVLSSEGRMSAWVLGVMPFCLGALLNAMNPAFMKPMWEDPIGVSILQYLAVMMIFGVLVLRRIVRIRI